MAAGQHCRGSPRWACGAHAASSCLHAHMHSLVACYLPLRLPLTSKLPCSPGCARLQGCQPTLARPPARAACTAQRTPWEVTSASRRPSALQPCRLPPRPSCDPSTARRCCCPLKAVVPARRGRRCCRQRAPLGPLPPGSLLRACSSSWSCRRLQRGSPSACGGGSQQVGRGARMRRGAGTGSSPLLAVCTGACFVTLVKLARRQQRHGRLDANAVDASSRAGLQARCRRLRIRCTSRPQRRATPRARSTCGGWQGCLATGPPVRQQPWTCLPPWSTRAAASAATAACWPPRCGSRSASPAQPGSCPRVASQCSSR